MNEKRTAKKCPFVTSERRLTWWHFYVFEEYAPKNEDFSPEIRKIRKLLSYFVNRDGDKWPVFRRSYFVHTHLQATQAYYGLFMAPWADYVAHLPTLQVSAGRTGWFGACAGRR